MFRKYNYAANRIVNRISKDYVYGPIEKKDPENNLDIFNLSDHALKVSYRVDDIITRQKEIYPLVIGNLMRPKHNETLIIQGMDLDKQPYTNEFTRSDFKRKLNTIFGYIDYERFDMHSTNQIWIKEVVKKSDIIRINKGNTCIIYKTQENIGTDWYIIVLAIMFITIFVSLIITILCLKYILGFLNDSNLSQ